MDVRQFPVGLRQAIEHDPARLVSRVDEARGLHEGVAIALADQRPAILDRHLVRPERRLLEQLAAQAAGEVDATVGRHVVEIGGAGREIDLAGVHGMVGHDAQDEGAVGAAQTRHGEAIAARGAGLAEADPGDEARIIDRRVGRAVKAAFDAPAMLQQHGAVEH